MSEITKVSRQEFIQMSMVGTIGLSLQFSLRAEDKPFKPTNKGFNPNVYLHISDQHGVVFFCHRSEMGQGVRTSMTQLLAEELELSPEKIRVAQAPGHPKYGDQNTDGSTSVRKNWTPLRKAGATAKEMLLKAASRDWGISKRDCFAKDGFILNTKDERKIEYTKIASKATLERVPTRVKLKPISKQQVIGVSHKSPDLKNIITGSAVYGIDIEVPGMLYASVERAPFKGAKVLKFEPSEALKIPGVEKILKVDGFGSGINSRNGVVVLAENYFAAVTGRKKLKINWSNPKGLEYAKDYQKYLKSRLDGKMTQVKSSGSIKRELQKSAHKLKREYSTPFLVHAQMEPVCALADFKNNKCEVWAPSQDPQRARKMIAKSLGIRESNVIINITLLGGGFGRKSQPDFLVEAAAISKKAGRPIKVIWSREDDTQHGFYHAAAMQRIESGFDQKGNIKAFHHRSVFPSNRTIWNANNSSPAPWEMGMGASNFQYQTKAFLCESGTCKTPLQIGWLRAVSNIQHAFSVNSILDEMAEKVGQDPIELRLAQLGKKKGNRLRNVIERVNKISEWEKKSKSKDSHLGFAAHYSFYSYVAMVLEVEGQSLDNFRITKAYCTVDCGVPINPDHIKAQIEGAVAFGLSLTLYGKIDQKEGRVIQDNFHKYHVLRNEMMPEVEVEIVDSNESPTGIGEPGVPPVAPALTNALFKLTQKRIYELPVLKNV